MATKSDILNKAIYEISLGASLLGATGYLSRDGVLLIQDVIGRGSPFAAPYTLEGALASKIRVLAAAVTQDDEDDGNWADSGRKFGDDYKNECGASAGAGVGRTEETEGLCSGEAAADSTTTFTSLSSPSTGSESPFRTSAAGAGPVAAPVTTTAATGNEPTFKFKLAPEFKPAAKAEPEHEAGVKAMTPEEIRPEFQTKIHLAAAKARVNDNDNDKPKPAPKPATQPAPNPNPKAGPKVTNNHKGVVVRSSLRRELRLKAEKEDRKRSVPVRIPTPAPAPTPPPADDRTGILIDLSVPENTPAETGHGGRGPSHPVSSYWDRFSNVPAHLLEADGLPNEDVLREIDF